MNSNNDMHIDVLIIKHHFAEGPGSILHWAKDQALTCEVVEATDDLPGNAANYSSLILLGGPMSANDNEPRLNDEKTLLLKFLAAKKPVFGICLGAQLIAQALGCDIKTMPRPELGWHLVEIDNHKLSVPQWHQEEIIANHKIKVFAESKHCSTQAFTSGNHVLGFQFHPEWSAESINLLHLHFEDCPLTGEKFESEHQALEVFLFNWLDQWWQQQIGANK